MSQKKTDQGTDFLHTAIAGRISREEQRAAVEAAGHRYYYTPGQEFDDLPKKMVIDETRPFMRPGRMLELGYINNIWTSAMLEAGAEKVDILEAASNHVAKARADFANDARVEVIHTLFEDYRPKELYDTIVMAGVIKHVPDDLAFVQLARTWLKPGGVVLASTPNSRSFHRRLGAHMELELAPDRHNRRDREVFNVRLYDRYSWRALFVEAGYDVVALKGIFLKILSTAQMLELAGRQDISKLLEGLRQLGEELQDYAWYILLVARARPGE
jgi:SAM-dependent methyltransferase